MLNLKMPDINTITIAGNLTNEPTLRQTQNGTSVTNFFMASNRKFKDNTGQWRESVCFVGVVAWYKLAESCYEYLTKGSSVLVEGELQSRTWKNEDGGNNNVVEIKARRIQFLDRQSRKSDSIVVEENGEVATDALEVVDDNADMNEGEVLTDSEQSQAVSKESEFNFGYEDVQV